MPTIEAAAFDGTTNKPFAWVCTNCLAVFALERITPNPTISELKRIDADFRRHCQESHKGDTVIGLDIPNPKEDTSQAAARIVREATEQK
jgi:hypothetical protein